MAAGKVVGDFGARLRGRLKGRRYRLPDPGNRLELDRRAARDYKAWTPGD